MVQEGFLTTAVPQVLVLRQFSEGIRHFKQKPYSPTPYSRET